MRELIGVEPKCNRIRFSLLMWLTLKDGKIVEKRAHFDAADIRRLIDFGTSVDQTEAPTLPPSRSQPGDSPCRSRPIAPKL